MKEKRDRKVWQKWNNEKERKRKKENEKEKITRKVGSKRERESNVREGINRRKTKSIRRVRIKKGKVMKMLALETAS